MMDASSATILLKALDCLSARAEITAQNIANAGTLHYRPLRLSFEHELAQAAGKGDAAVRDLTTKITRPVLSSYTASGSEMRLDLELATANSTALRYAALVEVLNRQLQINALAMPGGN